MEDYRLVKKNLLKTSSQVKNTLQEVDVSSSKSTIKRHYHESKYGGFTTGCKSLITLKNGKIRL